MQPQETFILQQINTMSCSKKTLMIAASSTLASLPLEILAEIFIKLPAKSLVRIRCVSKLFCSLVIDHPDLYSNWALTLPSRMSILIVVPRSYPHLHNQFYTINYPQQTQGTLQLNRLHHMDDHNLFRNLYLRSCVNGLLCFCPYPQSGDDTIAIYNPSTTQHISLPPNCSQPPLNSHQIMMDVQPPLNSNQIMMDVCALMGFDSVSKRYKVLKSVKFYDGYGYLVVKHWVFTLGMDKSWREIHCFPSYYPYDFINPLYIPYHFRTSVHIDGVIYSLNSIHQDLTRFDIVAFDVVAENFRTIPSPVQGMYPSSGLIEVEGRLAIVHGSIIDVGKSKSKIRHSYDMEIWTLEESMGWEKHIIPIPIPLKDCQSVDATKLLFFTANHVGEIALLVMSATCVSVLFYNFRRQDWRSFGIGELYGPLINNDMSQSVALQFIVDNTNNVF